MRTIKNMAHSGGVKGVFMNELQRKLRELRMQLKLVPGKCIEQVGGS